jgi:hypothetical protein
MSPKHSPPQVFAPHSQRSIWRSSFHERRDNDGDRDYFLKFQVVVTGLKDNWTIKCRILSWTIGSERVKRKIPLFRLALWRIVRLGRPRRHHGSLAILGRDPLCRAGRELRQLPPWMFSDTLSCRSCQIRWDQLLNIDLASVRSLSIHFFSFFLFRRTEERARERERERERERCEGGGCNL